MKNFVKDIQGGITFFTVLGFAFFVVAGGIAVDTARGWRLKVHLQHALDSAGLAAAVTTDNAELEEQMNAFFGENFGDDFMGATVDGPEYEVSDDNRIVTLNATATMPTYFMRLAGITDMTASATTEVTRETRGMELVMVLDVTGSMAQNGKIGALRTAATSLVNNLYGDNETLETLWVALVPYTAAVNIGTQYSSWLSNYDASAYTPSTWKGCVEERDDPTTGENAISDDTAAQAGGWPQYFWADASDNNWITNAGVYQVNETLAAGSSARGPNLGCLTPILPLIQSKTTLLNTISGLQASWARGGTMSDIGMAWGWRVISPKWRGLWQNIDPTTLPMDYNTPLMDKVAILLTDGDNQFYDYGSDGQVNGSDYTGHRRMGNGRVNGFTTYNATKTAINNRLLAVCAAMKAQNIKIYTITFQVTDNPTKDVYRTCASDPSYYYNSPDNAQLQEVFDAISDSLAHLYLSK